MDNDQLTVESEQRRAAHQGMVAIGAELAAAVRNNAEWCDTVCRARGIPGRFTEHLWINERQTPPYYPNIITLRPSSDALLHELADAVARVGAAVGGGLSIKDSFADVDLTPHRLGVLFGAAWIARPASLAPPAGVDGVTWSIVRDEGGLDAWKTAWDAEIVRVDPVFGPALLRDDGIAFFAAHRRGELVGGVIANKGAGVVGLSNVFARAAVGAEVWVGCLGAAMAWAPGLAVVGYESGADLPLTQELGFRTMGQLRVWVATSGG